MPSPGTGQVYGMKQETMVDDEYLELFRRLIQHRCGIFISPDKNYLLQSKLYRLLNRTGHRSLASFYQLLRNNDAAGFEDLVRYITTTHTFFFREKEHFAILCDDIIRKRKNRPLIWCAASSTGEEVYSMIMELLERGVNDFLIVASDINRAVLMRLKKGVYSREKVECLDEKIREKYFRESSAGNNDFFSAKEHLRSHFIVKRLNLVDELRFEQPFDYIFCRNALIYFDKQTQQRVLENLLNNLKPDGYLFVGHSEALLTVSDRVAPVFPSVYRIRQVHGETGKAEFNGGL